MNILMKIVVLLTILQFGISLPLADENADIKLPLEGSIEQKPEEESAKLIPAEEQIPIKSKNPKANKKHVLQPAPRKHIPVPEDSQHEMEQNSPNNEGQTLRLPAPEPFDFVPPQEGSTNLLPSVPDLEQIKRDQLFALAMAQFVQYTRSLAKQSEDKLGAILKDLEQVKDDNNSKLIDVETKAITKYLKKVKRYHMDVSSMMAKTIAIPLNFQKLVEDLKSQAKGNIDMEQILQLNNLDDFGKDFANYFDGLKRIHFEAIEKFIKKSIKA
ncbi:uncharacterized protein LOC106085681 [Stomoxys calcitrans]|uniref:uncharacterized protein LOC106085681 n=1 Tax=Stomoxys calcitrans TaxID=35570 RepID=UPI0027E29B9C|nr:uncharacterized protein LOC106085681 [Stomoxys calcitrans]